MRVRVRVRVRVMGGWVARDAESLRERVVGGKEGMIDVCLAREGAL
jgi:hypothetical protein